MDTKECLVELIKKHIEKEERQELINRFNLLTPTSWLDNSCIKIINMLVDVIEKKDEHIKRLEKACECVKLMFLNAQSLIARLGEEKYGKKDKKINFTDEQQRIREWQEQGKKIFKTSVHGKIISTRNEPYYEYKNEFLKGEVGE
jgi:hypothetical protein